MIWLSRLLYELCGVVAWLGLAITSVRFFSKRLDGQAAFSLLCGLSFIFLALWVFVWLALSLGIHQSQRRSSSALLGFVVLLTAVCAALMLGELRGPTRSLLDASACGLSSVVGITLRVLWPRRTLIACKLKPAGIPVSVSTLLLVPLPILFAVAMGVIVGPAASLLYLMFCSLVSAITIICYAYDKAAAIKNTDAKHHRIRESRLHLLEALGGWPGAVLAQGSLRHKTVKKSYRRAFVGLVLLHCIVVTAALVLLS